MEAIIWTKTTSTGAKIEFGLNGIYVNGERQDMTAGPSRELPRNKQVSKDGKLYSRVAGMVALTVAEAAEYDNAYFAALTARGYQTKVTGADRSDELAYQMSREGSDL